MAEDTTTNEQPEEPGKQASAPDTTPRTADAASMRAEEHDLEEEPIEAPGIDESENEAAEDDADDEAPLEPDPHRIPALNRRIEGRLVLSYPTRTVAIACDGDAALRALALLAGSSDARFRDELDPSRSTAVMGWIVLDPDVLAAVWEPTFGEEPPPRQRIVVDPVPPVLYRSTHSESRHVAT